MIKTSVLENSTSGSAVCRLGNSVVLAGVQIQLAKLSPMFDLNRLFKIAVTETGDENFQGIAYLIESVIRRAINFQELKLSDFFGIHLNVSLTVLEAGTELADCMCMAAMAALRNTEFQRIKVIDDSSYEIDQYQTCRLPLNEDIVPVLATVGQNVYLSVSPKEDLEFIKVTDFKANPVEIQNCINERRSILV
jgi:exosome complex RNA-binding protein Rrp42 (RNase PH superfamily)